MTPAEFESYFKRVRRFSSTREWEDRYLTMLKASALDSVWRPKVLDFGCGTGAGFSVFNRHYIGVYVGIEQGHMFEYLRRTRPEMSVYRTLIGASTVPVDFDAVLFSSSLAHVHDPIQTLIDARKLLRPGGRVVIMTNTRAFGQWRWLLNKVKGYRDDPTLKHRFSPKALEGVMVRTGFGVLGIEFLGDDAVPGFTPKSHRYFMMAVGYKKCSEQKPS